MSNTRHAKPGSPPRQERFCSSQEFERGLVANVVAQRCEVLDDAEQRKLVFFLQYISHQPGGLKQFAAELVRLFPDQLGTPSLLKCRHKQRPVCNAEEVQRIRAEIPNGTTKFPLRGEDNESFWIPDLTADDEIAESLGQETHRLREIRRMEAEAERIRNSHPEEYPAAVFAEFCQRASGKLHEHLEEMCINPGKPVAAPWYFPSLIECLYEHLQCRAGRIQEEFVLTEVGKGVFSALEFALEERCMVLVEGVERIGKTASAKAWCEAQNGLARYVQVPSSNDEISFYRAIAESIGVSTALSLKAVQLRERIDYVLQRTKIMLVFDEAHYLWPQANIRQHLPIRINWIMTALVNHGVPVALVTTPQFTRQQTRVEEKTGWASGQFIGRIHHYEALPSTLSEKDLSAVARKLLPEGCATSIRALVKHAESSKKYLAAIEVAVKRARYLVKKANREKVSIADVVAAIETVTPSDNKLKIALAEAAARKRRPSRPREAAPIPMREHFESPQSSKRQESNDEAESRSRISFEPVQ